MIRAIWPVLFCGWALELEKLAGWPLKGKNWNSMETLILLPIPTSTEKPTALGFLSSLLFKSGGGEIQAEEQASNPQPTSNRGEADVQFHP